MSRLITAMIYLVAVLAAACDGGMLNSLLAAETPAQILAEAGKEAKFKEGAARLQTRLEQKPEDAEVRFTLGLIQFLGAIDEFAASQYKYGAGGGTAKTLDLPFFRGIPDNPSPSPVTHAQTQEVFSQLGKSIAVAEKTLAGLETTQVKIPFRPGQISLDLNRDGKVSDDESFWQLLSAVNPAMRSLPANAFLVQIDEGDAVWLRGYCHFLMAICDMSAAYNTKEMFERAGHMIYAKPVTPYPWNQETEPNEYGNLSFSRVADVIAMIHLVNFEVADAGRMPSAHAHLLEMVRLSRISWKLYEAETDDDAEWIPNHRQQNVVIGLRVSREQITGWHKVLDEVEAVLLGKKLIPFWRGSLVKSSGVQGRGVNLAKVFQKPERFDMVLWVSGTGAAPFIEEGPLSTEATWNELQRVFGGRFFGFAAWFN